MESTVRYAITPYGAPYLQLSVQRDSEDVRDNVASMFSDRLSGDSFWLVGFVSHSDRYGKDSIGIYTVDPGDLQETANTILDVVRSKNIPQRVGADRDYYCTEIHAVKPGTTEMCKWAGPKIRATSFEDAQKYCEENGLGYCTVVGKLG